MVWVFGAVHVHEWADSTNQARWPLFLQRNGMDAPRVFRGEVLSLRKGDLVPDTDQCTADGCSFPNGLAQEDPAGHRITRYRDDVGGYFGKLNSVGEFVALDPSQVDEITHYQPPLDGPTTGDFHVWVEVDDAGYGLLGLEHGTSDDPPYDPQAHMPTTWCFGIDDPGLVTQRSVSSDDACGCTSCAPGFSSIDPLSGAVMFDVPVTSWTYRGTELGFSLHYHSNLRADPALNQPGWAKTQASPDFAHFATRNSRWTHA